MASLLAKALRLDWRKGAQLFDCLLIDDERAINWMNWRYNAGVGNDPRDRVSGVLLGPGGGERFAPDGVCMGTGSVMGECPIHRRGR